MAAVPIAVWIAELASVTVPAVYAFLAGATAVIAANTLRHILANKEHGFNDQCGIDCVQQVANKLRITGNETVNKHSKGAQIIEKQGACKHGCTIVLRFNVDPKLNAPTLTTGFHRGPCKAK